MAGGYKNCKTFGLAEARRRRIKPERLVTPGAVERMLADRHQLQMGEPQAGGIGRQLQGQFLPTGKASTLAEAPGCSMDFIDRQRRLAGIGRSTLGRQTPGSGQRRDDAGRVGPQLGRTCIGVSFERQQFAIGRDDFKLVQVAQGRMRNENFPDAGGMAQAHAMAPAIPLIEAADDADPARIRRPDGKTHAVDMVLCQRMGAEQGKRSGMIASSQQGQVGIAELRPEGIGVGIDALAAVSPGHGQAVIETLAPARHQRLKKVAAWLQTDECPGGQRIEQLDLAGPWQQRAQPESTLSIGMQAQQGKRVGIAPGQQFVDLVLLQHCSAHGLDRPDPVDVLRDCAVGRKLTHACDVQYRF